MGVGNVKKGMRNTHQRHGRQLGKPGADPELEFSPRSCRVVFVKLFAESWAEISSRTIFMDLNRVGWGTTRCSPGIRKIQRPRCKLWWATRRRGDQSFSVLGGASALPRSSSSATGPSSRSPGAWGLELSRAALDLEMPGPAQPLEIHPTSAGRASAGLPA